MEAAYRKIKELDSENPQLPSMELQVNIAQKNWAPIESDLMSVSEDKRYLKARTIAAPISTIREDVPVELFRKLIANLDVEPETGSKDPYAVFQMSKLQWLSGEKEAAITSAEEALEIANHPLKPTDGTPYMVYLIKPYVEKLKQGEMADEEQLSAWLNEGIKSVQEAARAKAQQEKAAKENADADSE